MLMVDIQPSVCGRFSLAYRASPALAHQRAGIILFGKTVLVAKRPAPQIVVVIQGMILTPILLPLVMSSFTAGFLRIKSLR